MAMSGVRPVETKGRDGVGVGQAQSQQEGAGSHLGTRNHKMVRQADVSWHVSLLLQGEVVHSQPQLSRPSPLGPTGPLQVSHNAGR